MQFRFQDLEIWRRGAEVSVFEVANILMMLSKDNYLPVADVRPFLSKLEEESRMLLAFRRGLKS